jgi:hypothetical protein
MKVTVQFGFEAPHHSKANITFDSAEVPPLPIPGDFLAQDGLGGLPRRVVSRTFYLKENEAEIIIRCE